MNTQNASFAADYCPERTARQKKRLQKKEYDKQLIALSRRRQRISDLIHKAPLVPLEKAYQKGWKRLFVLTDATAERENAVFYQAVLDKINTTVYHYDKRFPVKKRKRGKKIYAVQSQTLITIRENEFDRYKFAKSEKQLFDRREFLNKDQRTIGVRYVFSSPWLFRLRVYPHIITHIKMRDAALEQELKLIENRIHNRNLFPRMQKLTDGGRWGKGSSYFRQEKHKSPFKHKPLHVILNEAKNETLNS